MLDARPDSPARLLHSAVDPDITGAEWVLIEGSPGKNSPALRVRVQADEDDGVVWIEEEQRDGEWKQRSVGRFGAPG